jgi:DNA-binding response OmpR family regulator
MYEPKIDTNIVIASVASRQDQTCLRNTLALPPWQIRFTQSLIALDDAARTVSTGVVITDRQLMDGSSWKDVLTSLDRHLDPPQLIVADRLADEALWAEVLNLGGYDLLISPFDPGELQRVVTLAWEYRARKIARKGMRYSRLPFTASAASA